MCCFPACHLHLLPLLLPALLILICGISHGIIKGAQAEQQQNSQAAGGQQQQQFAQQSLLLPSQQHRGRHRSRRAPAVWGEPAPDYSMAALDPRTHIYLYALLFVDLKTSDHYRREHALVRREVMRMAREANNYFFQINLRLVVVDVLETFRDDLSLYSFEQYRNQRLAQLPFHNFAVLITYRYAGGLAFVGGMCSSKSVMLAGFYPHNPEAMGSIFFHEVAHLVGVPHRPPNETLDVPNCACAGRQAKAGHNGMISQTPLGPTGEPVSKSNLMLANQSLRGPGCLKIPGFDQDCSLQLMVNLALRTRCLAREPRPDQWSLPLCGNGLREGNEQCDCGLATKCAEWNCEPQTCARHWPLWAMWLSAFGFCLALAGPGLLCLWLRGQLSPRRAKRRRLLFVRLPSETLGKQQMTGKLHRKLTIGQRQGRGQPLLQSARAIRCRLVSMAKPFHALWKRFSGPKSWKGEQLKPSLPTSPSQDTNGLIRRPLKPPPPPPPLANLLSSPNSTLGRPKKPPPPRPPSSRQCLQNLLPSSLASASHLPPSPSLIVRPTALPPAPPRQQDQQQKRPPPPAAEEKLPSPLPEILGSEAEEEDEWDDYCE